MKESIIIRNFGPIKEIEIDDIRPLTVFIGESGSGKSTIIKVIVLFRWIYKWLNIRSYLKHANISNSPFSFDFKDLLNKNGLIEYLKEGETEIIYKKGEISIEYIRKLKTSPIVSVDELSLEKMCFITDRRNVIPDILTNRVNLQSDFYLKETLDDTLLSLKEISQLDLDYLGVRFVTKKVNGIPKYEIENINDEENYTINLHNASSGTQTLVPLSVIVEYFSRHYDFNSRFNQIVFDYLSRNDSLKDFKTTQNIGDIKYRNVHIHIEEPELSLYPESQRSLLNFIVNRCLVQKEDIDYNMTVMMATHSPYIINHLNLLIMAAEKNVPQENAMLKFSDVDVYEVTEGYLEKLNRKEKYIIDTRPLSEPISDIYNEYEALKK